MKKLLTAIALLTAVATTSANAVSKQDQATLSSILSESGLQNMWSQDVSLWIKNPGYDKYTLESFGHQICASTRGKGLGFFVITFWHQLGSGQITKVKCSS